jgi:4-amino-4-deoxy-L-arabinose transferase-like glycosyltransferase
VTYGALAAALVTAGPLPALWPLGALALYLGLARLEGGWRLAQPLPGLVLMIGLAVPWYGAMAERHGGEFLAHAPFFPYALEPRAGWYLGPLLAVSYVVVGFFPWAALLPAALQHATTWWRRPRVDPTDAASTAAWISPIARELREETAAHYFIACGVAALVPIVFYPRPPFPAVLPALPAAALLCGR